MIFKRMTAALLLLCICIVPLLSACSGDGGGTDTESGSQTSSTGGGTDAETEKYPYPNAYYDDASFVFLVREDGYWGQDYDDIWVETTSGDKLETAVYKRNLAVEDRYGVVISQKADNEPSTLMQTLIGAGDDTYRAVKDKLSYTMQRLGVNGYLYPMDEVPNLNLDAEWYNQVLLDQISIAGKTLLLGGDGIVSDKMSLFCLLMNKELAGSLDGITDIYTTVRNGEWTFDKLTEYAALGSYDLNGDQVMSKDDDRWGLLIENTGLLMFMEASGDRMVEKNSSGELYFNVGTEEYQTRIQKIMKLMYNKTLREGRNWGSDAYTAAFTSGRALFCYTALSSAPEYRGMETAYAIIPFPKYDEAQTDYISPTSPWVARMISIPISNSYEQLQMTGTVIDAMFRENYGTEDSVLYAYYDTLLSQKVAREEDDREMLTIAFTNVSYDLGVVFNWGGVWSTLTTLAGSQGRAIASAWAAIKVKAEKELEESIALFESYTYD